MREKQALKQKYKQLVRSGKQEEADRTLEQIWKLCESNKTIPRAGKTVPKVEAKGKYTKEDLEKLSFSELRVIGYKFGTKGRGKSELVKEILELQ